MPNEFAVPSGPRNCRMHYFVSRDRHPEGPDRAYALYSRTETHFLAAMEPLSSSRSWWRPRPPTEPAFTVQWAVIGDPSQRRGVAIIGPNASEQEISELNRVGARGIRCNVVSTRLPKVASAREIVGNVSQPVRPFTSHLQIVATARQIAGIAQVIRASEVPVVLDHTGGASRKKRSAFPRGIGSACSRICSGEGVARIGC